MTWIEMPLSILDGTGVLRSIVAYFDGTNFSFAHSLLDNTGAIIAPATSTNQATMITSLATIATNSALQSTSALQTSAIALLTEIEASLTGTLAVGITGSVPLPTGASTAALQTTGNTSLATIATNTTGAATAANQATSNTALSAIQTSVANIPAAPSTAALQTTGNTSLAAIASSLSTGVPTEANTSGGTSVYAAWGGTTNAAFTNTPIQIKSSPGNLYGLAGMSNSNASTVYMQFFDLASGSVTLGTTPPKMVMPLVQGAVYDRDFTDEEKITFGTMITVAVTTQPSGSTAPATGILGNIIYK